MQPRKTRMEATRNMKLDTLKARIGRSDYEVDPHAVAEAIVRRLVGASVEPVPGRDGPGPSHPGRPAAA